MQKLIVTATRKGYYQDRLRIPGTPSAIFELAKKSDFAERWMKWGEETVGPTATVASRKRAAADEEARARGVNAVLDAALKDLAEANAKIAELQSRIVDMASGQAVPPPDVPVADEDAPAPEVSPPTEDAGEVPGNSPAEGEPVRRQRITRS